MIIIPLGTNFLEELVMELLNENPTEIFYGHPSDKIHGAISTEVGFFTLLTKLAA